MRDSRDPTLLNGRSFAALLFDMDGTLITSVAVAERVWTRWAASHGLDASTFIHKMHGKRAVDTIRALNVPGLDPVAEAHAVTLMEIDDLDGVRSIAGAVAFVDSLPADRWAVVTSAPRTLATRRLEAAGLKIPAVLVTAEDVTVGKPDPSGYLLAANQLGASPADCAIFEDADAGIRAGESAGGQVIVITETHTHPIESAHPAFPDFTRLGTKLVAGRIHIAHRT